MASNEKYPALTGIRAWGAIVVFFDHFPFQENTRLGINVMAFFFVLSGFLIVRIYYDQATLKARWLSKYFVNRFARIYPVYFLLLTIAVFLHHDFRPLMLIKNYTLTHALFHNAGDFVIEPSWSLTAEECFYFLAPLIILLTRLYHFMVPFIAAIGLLVLALFISNAGLSFLGTPMFVFNYTFFGHFLEFFAGVYLALALMRLERKGVAKVAGNKWTIAGVLAVIAAAVPSIIVYAQRPLNFSAIVLINNFLIPFPIALLYFGLMRENTVLSRALSGKIPRLLGRSSYSFYLLHTIVIDYLSKPFLLPFFGGHRYFVVMLTFLITWLLSILLYACYEEPLNLFIRGKFKSRQVLAPSRT